MWRALFLVVCAANIHVAISAECGLNERFIACPDTMCIPQYCSERGTKVPCPILGPDGECPGKPRCICIEGYLRDDTSANANGTCIKEETCKPPSTATSLDEKTTGERHSCGCGYPPICPKGEEYYNCTGGCIPRKCSELGFPLDCSKCTPGCVCKDGLVRADNGSCIPVNKCPSCGGDKNAQQGCGSNCNKMCADIGKPPKRCPLGCIFNGCTCRPCYYYDPNEKKCVKPEDCTPTCSANEEYSTCIQSGCTAKNCSQLGKPVPCIKIDPKYCIKGCVCKKGMLRNSKGICVPENQCDNYPPKCPKGEEYNNCTGGCTLRKCSELGFPLDCDKCTPGCVCKDGLVRASNDSCIPANECPSCGGDKNAQQGCGNCNKMCSDIGKPPGPCPLRPCRINDCTCKPGFYYDPDKKKCVKPEHCTDYPPKCPKGEEYNNCTGGCTLRKCSELGFPLDCDKCTPGCVCKDGLVRASNGSCIPANECPSCGGDKNAQQGCGNCNKLCSDVGKPPRPCPKILCVFNGCTCKPGYYYDPDKKKCVKPEHCPDNPPECPKGEEYNNCTGGCTLRKCSELGFPLDCDKCTPGCVCKDGLVRASNGSCIPANECPSCGGDKNAQQGCGNCNKMCSDIGKPPGPCPRRPCRINDCTCKPGFYYDPDKKKCVKPEHCTVKCGPNEVFSNCPNPCPPRKCNLKDAVFKCKAPPQPGDPECKPGCTCENNYYRNATGSCVLKENCEKPLKCPDNEHYDPCPMTCPPQECGVNPAVILCLPNPEYGDPNCKPGCVCRDGELRNDARKCVPKECC